MPTKRQTRTAQLIVRLFPHEKKAAMKRLMPYESLSDYLRRLILADCAVKEV